MEDSHRFLKEQLRFRLISLFRRWYSRIPNISIGRNKSIGWNFSQNLIKVWDEDEPNNSIARKFLTQCNKHIGWEKKKYRVELFGNIQ